jgi:Tfp pilus assembly protein PilX
MIGFNMKCMRQKQKGTILVLVIMIMVVLLITGLGLLRLGYSSRILAARSAFEISAIQAADAGFTQAKLLMDKKLNDELVWDNSILPIASDVSLANSNATYSYVVTGDASGFTVTSTGTASNATRTVNGLLRIKSLWTGLSVQNTLDIKSGTTLMSDPEGEYFAIRSNSIADASIVLKANTSIPGDIIIGPGGDIDDAVSMKATTEVTGTMFAAAEEIYYPPVVVPTDLTSISEIPYTYAAGVPLTGNNKFSSINLNGIQEVNGNCKIYVTGGIILQNSAELVVPSGSSLELYIGVSFEGKNGSELQNDTSDATNLKIYGLDTCTSIDIKNGGDFYAAIYAPNADLVLHNGGIVEGSFVGNNFEMKNSGTFIYDTDLGDVGIDDLAASFNIFRWWED